MGVVNLRRNILQIFVIVSLVVSTIGFTGVGAASPPVISVEPPTITKKVGETFTIDVTITDVTVANSINGIYTWQFGMSFDPSVLNATSVMEGPFLKDTGYATSWNMMPPEINNYEGTIKASNALWLYPPESQGAIGSGVLCNITFQSVDIGRTTLHFYDENKTFLLTYVSPDLKLVEHTTVDGFFTNVHDVAVVDVEPSTTSVVLGDPVSIDVTVANEGDFPETFDVTTYWDIGALRGVIGTKTVTNLEGGTSTTPPLAFTWDTTGICTGTYNMSAEASLQGETDPADNTLIDDVVTVFHPEAPVANFTSSPEKPEVHETVTFNATASYDPNGQIVSWDWNFNDGNVGSGEVVTHAYTEAGTYNVTLTVEDNDGLCNILWKPVKVVDYPVAKFTYSPEEPRRNRTVTFDASGSTPDGGTIISYFWDFGDEINATGVIVDHSYANSGTYPVTLTVTDDEGLTDSTTRNVTVLIKHDVAVDSVSCYYPGSPKTISHVYAGELVKIAIVVVNEGTEIETFNVTVYLGDTAIETRELADLAPLNDTPVSIYWNTTNLSAGKYTITAEAILVGDENSTNNKATTPMDISVADIALTNVTASSTTVLAGDLLNVSVTVKNEGTVTPTIAPLVKIYFTNATHSNIPIIDSFSVPGLENGTEKTELKTWDITDVNQAYVRVDNVEVRISPGTYTLSAEVSPVQVGADIVESDLADNSYIYGNVTVGASLISISANPANTTVGSRTTIKGSITPKRSGVNVVIRYRLSGNETWNTLETVTTDENSTYSYDWKPDTVGIYEIKASWEGDNDALPSESEILTIRVGEAPPSTPYLLLAGAVVAMIIGAAIAIYFLRVRKLKPK